MIIGTLMAIETYRNHGPAFTRFTILNEKPPDGYVQSWERVTKNQAATRSDHLWSEIWSSMSKAAQRKEKQQWAIQKQKIDNARKLRDIYVIDPDDKEFDKPLKKHRKVGTSNGSRYAL